MKIDGRGDPILEGLTAGRFFLLSAPIPDKENVVVLSFTTLGDASMIRQRWLCMVLCALALGLVSIPVFAGEKKSDTVIPMPREGGWMARHNKMNERVKQGNVDLVFIGDSITQGWEGGGKKVWEKFYGKRNAVNLGISGDRTQHVIWRLQNGNLTGIAPKLAVIMIGTNNSGTNTPEDIADGVKEIVKVLQAKTPRTKILILGVFPRGPDAANKQRQVNEKTNAIIKTFADNKQIHYLDIGQKFLQDDGTLSKDIMPDLLHLNERSYTIWAEAIEPKVKELMSE
jgi:lysophospholipase L1-like esterase